MKYLAIIPARSGSKGLKDKNILPLGGIPLSAWTINAARESRVFDEIHFSTDAEKYAEIAKDNHIRKILQYLAKNQKIRKEVFV